MSSRTSAGRSLAAMTLCAAVLAPGVAHARAAAATHNLSLALTIKSSGPITGMFPATLAVTKHVVSGSIDINSYACTVNVDSTDVHSVLNMTCSVLGGLDTVTLTGKLNVLSGKGRGTISDTYYGETGTYIFAPAQ